MILNCSPQKKIYINNKEHLYFGGTNYLGIASNKAFVKNITKGLKKWGSSYGSSRVANIQLSIYSEVENALASYIESEKTLILSSGTLAAKLAISSLTKNNSTFYHYPKAHPAILAENSIPLFINNEQELHPNLTTTKKEDIVIVMDSVSTLEVTVPKLSFLEQISKNKKITLLIDGSHSFGILGKHGEGIFNTIPKTHLFRKIMISSLNKSFGIPGGLIASDAKFINSLTKNPLFIASSGIIPAYLEAFKNSQDIYKTQLQQLKKNLLFFFKTPPSNLLLHYNPNYPVMYSKIKNLQKKLYEHNIIITHFNYPTKKSPTLSRIVINANHTKKDLIILKKALQAIHTKLSYEK